MRTHNQESVRSVAARVCFGLLLICGIVGVGIAVGTAEAASLTMDRNAEPDVTMYRAYTCGASATCTPTTRQPELDVAQPATGNPVKLIPPTLSGRVGYKAEDAVGNQSPLSNVVPFRGAPLNAPTGVQPLP